MNLINAIRNMYMTETHLKIGQKIDHNGEKVEVVKEIPPHDYIVKTEDGKEKQITVDDTQNESCGKPHKLKEDEAPRSDCCDAPISDEPYGGHGRCSSCGEMSKLKSDDDDKEQKEEVEIDELNTPTLGRYTRAAARDIATNPDKAKKRIAGIDKASHKTSMRAIRGGVKEEVELDEISDELKDKYKKKVMKKATSKEGQRDLDVYQGNNYTDDAEDSDRYYRGQNLDKHVDRVKKMTKESVELDEIKARTIGSYIRKATDNLARQKSGLASVEKLIKDKEEYSPKGAGAGIKSMAKIHKDNIKKREKGLEKADRALARKDQKEETQIDEISQDTKNSYIKKAKTQMRAADHLGATYAKAAQDATDADSQKVYREKSRRNMKVADKRSAGIERATRSEAYVAEKYGLTQSLLDAVNGVLKGDGTLDKVDPKEAKKQFKDRKDKDINNDGKVDNTDKYIAKKRQAVTKAVEKDRAETTGKGAKNVKDVVKGKGTAKIEPVDTAPGMKEEVEIFEMSDKQMKKREEIVKSMKKNKAGFEKRYGDRAKNVMYATATKMAQKEGFVWESTELFFNDLQIPLHDISSDALREWKKPTKENYGPKDFKTPPPDEKDDNAKGADTKNVVLRKSYSKKDLESKPKEIKPIDFKVEF